MRVSSTYPDGWCFSAFLGASGIDSGHKTVATRRKMKPAHAVWQNQLKKFRKLRNKKKACLVPVMQEAKVGGSYEP